MIFKDDFNQIIGNIKSDDIIMTDFFSVDVERKDAHAAAILELKKEPRKKIVELHPALTREYHVEIIHIISPVLDSTDTMITYKFTTVLRYKTKKAAMAALQALDALPISN